DSNGNVLWNDCLRTGEFDNSIVKTARQGYDYVTLRDSILRSKGLDYQPISLSEENIFMPYPESDVIQNHYLKEDPQAYTFSK
ncbi:MAG: RagB/SusD family nutrient uptake outer membrane protein, partial [Bacteroidaceae bacterium]|nr:RagB/SusD family nutrient uptake outer membrane protein [Bacteroidaceae bacterium]